MSGEREPAAWRRKYGEGDYSDPYPMWQTPGDAVIGEVEYLYALPPAAPAEPLQQRVQPWMMECFGPEIAADVQERCHRFLEEALELVQSCGATASEAHQLIDYVYGRPVGRKEQEVGGVMITLAALCLAQGLDMHAAGETELTRIWGKIDQIRAKQAAKPKHSPLPAAPAERPPLPYGPAHFTTEQIAAAVAEAKRQAAAEARVPREPTEAMIAAGRAVLNSVKLTVGVWKDMYDAALHGAPEPAEARDAQDAARYRWLRETECLFEFQGAAEAGELDAYVDAAMGERTP